LKNYVTVPSKSNMQQNLEKIVYVGVLKANDRNSESVGMADKRVADPASVVQYPDTIS
jgi:hypothetical protein